MLSPYRSSVESILQGLHEAIFLPTRNAVGFFLFCLFSPLILDDPYRGSCRTFYPTKPFYPWVEHSLFFVKVTLRETIFLPTRNAIVLFFLSLNPISHSYSKKFCTSIKDIQRILKHIYKCFSLQTIPMRQRPSFHGPRYPLPSMTPGIPFLPWPQVSPFLYNQCPSYA